MYIYPVLSDFFSSDRHDDTQGERGKIGSLPFGELRGRVKCKVVK